MRGEEGRMRLCWAVALFSRPRPRTSLCPNLKTFSHDPGTESSSVSGRQTLQVGAGGDGFVLC